jgi:hypothetical protein
MNVAKLEVYKCDNPKCEKIIENACDVFNIRFVSKGMKAYYGGHRPEYENREIELDFCRECARKITDSLDRIENIMSGPRTDKI